MHTQLPVAHLKQPHAQTFNTRIQYIRAELDAKARLLSLAHAACRDATNQNQNKLTWAKGGLNRGHDVFFQSTP